MAQVQFAKLKVGRKFTYKGKEYTKVKEVRKKCCIILYNAVSDNDDKITIPAHILVTINEN